MSEVPWKGWLMGLSGAVVGGVVGHGAAFWIARQGFYALVLPGALLGLGGGLLVRDRSSARGVVCGLAALGLGLFTDWRVEPFIKDSSLAYYLGHIHQLQPITWLMITAGGGFGYWLALGRERGIQRSKVINDREIGPEGRE